MCPHKEPPAGFWVGAEWDSTGGPPPPPPGGRHRAEQQQLYELRGSSGVTHRLWPRGKHRQQDALHTAAPRGRLTHGAVGLFFAHAVSLPVDTGPGNPSHGRSLPATQMLNGGSAHTQHRCFISSPAPRRSGRWQLAAAGRGSPAALVKHRGSPGRLCLTLRAFIAAPFPAERKTAAKPPEPCHETNPIPGQRLLRAQSQPAPTGEAKPTEILRQLRR